ncbi:MAG: hypothetical protein IKU65_00225 [Oscillospiraceae bacterium]|nr:hypothetical protein [Oscillospiraceae bacterium]
MKFFHVYNDWHVKGLEKNNLINEDTGFKIQHVFSMPGELKFNKYAAKGGTLHSRIKQDKIPFYVDRIAGGITYHKYDFDKELIHEYADILGDWFLGIQLHESASNIYDAEWPGILKRMEGAKGPYDVEELKARSLLKKCNIEDGRALYGFSHNTPENYARMTYPETSEAFREHMIDRYKKYLEETDGYILPVDSYYLMTKIYNELGMRTFMPEVGWQIGQMRIAVASARGTAENAGKMWGTYYETWIAAPTEYDASMPCFNNHPLNEWYLTQEQHGDDFTTHGPAGGSSRKLQKRIYYYSLMAGADYMGEEWGLNCSYTNMETFELSEYGLAKKEFIDFIRDHKKVKARVPFAIVLPNEYYCVQVENPFRPHHMGVHRDKYMQAILGDKQKAFNGYVEDVINLIYEVDGGHIGNEGHTLTNSRFGDLFDIIHEDAGEEVFAKYDALIDACPDGRISEKYGDKFRVFKGDDLEKLERDVKEYSKEILPATADKLLWVLSEDDKAKRYISIFNNEGNYRARPVGDTIDHAADARVKVSFKEAANLKPIKLSSDDIKIEKIDDTTYYVDMPATEFAIFEY